MSNHEDESAVLAAGRMVGSAFVMVLLWIVEAIANMVAHRQRDTWRWPMRDLRERISTRLAVDFIIIRSKVDLWLARRIRRKE